MSLFQPSLDNPLHQLLSDQPLPLFFATTPPATPPSAIAKGKKTASPDVHVRWATPISQSRIIPPAYPVPIPPRFGHKPAELSPHAIANPLLDLDIQVDAASQQTSFHEHDKLSSTADTTLHMLPLKKVCMKALQGNLRFLQLHYEKLGHAPPAYQSHHYKPDDKTKPSQAPILLYLPNRDILGVSSNWTSDIKKTLLDMEYLDDGPLTSQMKLGVPHTPSNDSTLTKRQQSLRSNPNRGMTSVRKQNKSGKDWEVLLPARRPAKRALKTEGNPDRRRPRKRRKTSETNVQRKSRRPSRFVESDDESDATSDGSDDSDWSDDSDVEISDTCLNSSDEDKIEGDEWEEEEVGWEKAEADQALAATARNWARELQKIYPVFIRPYEDDKSKLGWKLKGILDQIDVAKDDLTPNMIRCPKLGRYVRRVAQKKEFEWAQKNIAQKIVRFWNDKFLRTSPHG